MAVSGLLLSGFLVTHLAGNLLLLKGEAAFNAYAKALENNPLLPLAEVGLAAVFVIHILSGLWVSWENRQARPVGYEASQWAGGRTIGSATMAYTGFLLIAFLVVHLRTFRFTEHGGNLYRHVLEAFRNPLYTGFYVAAMGGMVLHLSHGFASAFQTLGLAHPRAETLIKRSGLAFSLSMLGFAALAVWAYFQGGPR